MNNSESSIQDALISIVIPVYNNERYLSTAIESVLKQPVKKSDDIEVVVVDDGSTDNTPMVADSYASNYAHVRVVHQVNQWIYASMNRGIDEAKGEYIYILNSDDALVDGVLSKMIDKIEEYNHPDVIWTRIAQCEVDDEQNIISIEENNVSVNQEKYFDGSEKIHNMWFFIQKSGLAHNQANLYKRELMVKHPFRNDIYGADVLFNLSIADEIKSMLFFPDIAYRFYSYNNDAMNASVGKYYDYEHEMFNEIMRVSSEIYKRWHVNNKEWFDFLVSERLKELTREIRALKYVNCSLSLHDKVKKIFTEYADPWIRKSARKVGREREYESRVLNGTRELLRDTEEVLDTDMSFVKLLVESLPDNYSDDVEKLNVDMELIDMAVQHNLNKDKIGIVYYHSKW